MTFLKIIGGCVLVVFGVAWIFKILGSMATGFYPNSIEPFIAAVLALAVMVAGILVITRAVKQTT